MRVGRTLSRSIREGFEVAGDRLKACAVAADKGDDRFKHTAVEGKLSD